jgi:hypothetical protein
MAAEQELPIGNVQTLYRWMELALLFFGAPAIYLLGWIPLPKIPFLLLLVAVLVIWLLRDPSFDRSQWWGAAGLRTEWRRLLARFLVLSSGIIIFAFLVFPGHFLDMPLEEPAKWAILMVAYPLLSVYPQEIAYRTFFYHRYGGLLRGHWPMVFLNAAAFGFMHVVYENWVAVLATFLGGILFADTFARTRSTAASTFEHGLYGCLMFTIGLGRFFS